MSVSRLSWLQYLQAINLFAPVKPQADWELGHVWPKPIIEIINLYLSRIKSGALCSIHTIVLKSYIACEKNRNITSIVQQDSER